MISFCSSLQYWHFPALRASLKTSFTTSSMDWPIFLRVRIFSTVSFFWLGSRSSAPQFLHVALNILRISLAKPTCITGATSSICPKWPGHSPALPPHVLHRRPGSITPSLVSINPISMGKPSSSYVSAVMILVTLIFLNSLGEISPNLICFILLGVAITMIFTYTASSNSSLGATPRDIISSRSNLKA